MCTFVNIICCSTLATLWIRKWYTRYLPTRYVVGHVTLRYDVGPTVICQFCELSIRAYGLANKIAAQITAATAAARISAMEMHQNGRARSTRRRREWWVRLPNNLHRLSLLSRSLCCCSCWLLLFVDRIIFIFVYNNYFFLYILSLADCRSLVSDESYSLFFLFSQLLSFPIPQLPLLSVDCC